MGGVLIVVVMLVTNLLVSDISNVFIDVLLVAMMGFASIGFIDDYKNLLLIKRAFLERKNF